MNAGGELMNMTATTLFGLEEVLMEELRELGAQDIEKVNRAVIFTGDKELLYKANLHLRTALRVLVPVHKFTAANEQELYNGVRQLNWSEYLDGDQTLAVESAVNSDFFNHSHYVSLKTKDAIVDQFRDKTGARPWVNIDNPDLTIHIHIFKDNCTISLDSSGETLHKRGYKTANTPAPLSEVLAAGMILLTGWRGEKPFVDPMCGSGTIALEAALIAANIAPGVFRGDFGFKHWKNFDAALWQKLYKEALNQERESKYKIIASDISLQAVRVAEENMQNAELEEKLIILKKSFEELEPPREPGIIVMNPPYGERLAEENIIQFYKEIGNTLKQKWNGFEAWILSSNRQALKQVGLRTSKKTTLYNGPLECGFYKYELYEGSKKNKG